MTSGFLTFVKFVIITLENLVKVVHLIIYIKHPGWVTQE